METFSASLAICAGISPVPSEFELEILLFYLSFEEIAAYKIQH